MIIVYPAKDKLVFDSPSALADWLASAEVEAILAKTDTGDSQIIFGELTEVRAGDTDLTFANQEDARKFWLGRIRAAIEGKP